MGHLGEDKDCVIFWLNKALLTNVPQLIGCGLGSSSTVNIYCAPSPRDFNSHMTIICYLKLVVHVTVAEGIQIGPLSRELTSKTCWQMKSKKNAKAKKQRENDDCQKFNRWQPQISVINSNCISNISLSSYRLFKGKICRGIANLINI